MKPKLSLITPCSRPHNLLRMEPSVMAGADLFDLTWWIVYDGIRVPDSRKTYSPNTFNGTWICKIATHMKPGSCVGNSQNNYALDRIDLDNWVYFLSDDNIMHENFYSCLSQAIADHPEKRAFVFPQQVGDWVRGAGPGSMIVGAIDLGQYCLFRSLIGERRLNAPSYDADGFLITELYQTYPGDFEFLPFVMCNYNKLR